MTKITIAEFDEVVMSVDKTFDAADDYLPSGMFIHLDQEFTRHWNIKCTKTHVQFDWTRRGEFETYCTNVFKFNQQFGDGLHGDTMDEITGFLDVMLTFMKNWRPKCLKKAK